MQNKKALRAPKRRAAAASGSRKRTQRDFELPRVSSRNGKALPNYNEADMFSDLSDEYSDDGWEYETPVNEEQSAFGLFVSSVSLLTALVRRHRRCYRRHLRAQA